MGLPCRTLPSKRLTPAGWTAFNKQVLRDGHYKLETGRWRQSGSLFRASPELPNPVVRRPARTAAATVEAQNTSCGKLAATSRRLGMKN